MHKQISTRTAQAIVISNMIGTGVFTSIGFQLSSLHNTWIILLLWLFGGILSLLGAFAYSELGTRYPNSGGDYIYLSKIIHPMAGYLSAWACLLVGFSAPVSLAAIAFTKYFPIAGVPSNVVAVSIIITISALHSFTLSHSSKLQNITTLLKVVFIVVLIAIGFAAIDTSKNNAVVWSGNFWSELSSGGFAVSMIYVSFAYTGWNAAAYIADEIKDAQYKLPKILINSTFVVTAIYLLFQIAVLYNATFTQLEGKEEASLIAFENIVGKNGGRWIGIFIALQLLATISSYVWVGSRVTYTMAQTYTFVPHAHKANKHQIPVTAIWIHAVISIVMVLTGSFEKILLYAGFVLQLMTALTIASSLLLKPTKATFITPLKPWPQIIFLLFSAYVLAYTMYDRPLESCIGIGIIALGVPFYYLGKQRKHV
jgi:APA family basic amino acid/polyamine antiporter